MSIQIGQKDIQATTRERIYLQSATESNLIILKSSRQDTRVLIQDYTIGQSTSNFVVGYSNAGVAPILTLNSNESTLTSDAVLTKSATVHSNVSVALALSTGTLVTGHTVIHNTAPTDPAAALFSIRSAPAPAGSELLTVTEGGKLLLPTNGFIGVGTTTALQSVHTEASALVRGTVFASNIAPYDGTAGVRYIRFEPVTELGSAFVTIRGAPDVRVLGNMSISQNFAVGGSFTLGQVVSAPTVAAQNLITTPQLDITSSNTSNVFFRMTYTGPMDGGPAAPAPPYGYSNLVDVRLRPADSNIHAFAINRLGHVGIGTDRPDAILSIRDTSTLGSLGAASNIVSFRGDTLYDAFVIDAQANVGLGTTTPLHALHIVNAEHTEPSIGLYNSVTDPADIADGCNVPPFFYAYSNAERVVALCGDGCLTLGPGVLSHSSDTRLNVRGDAVVECLETACIRGIPGPAPAGRDSNVDFLNSGIVGVSNLRANAAQINNAAVESIICNYMFTSNWEILGMQCFDSNMYGLSEFHIRTSNLLFTGGQAHFDERLEDIIDTNEDPRVTGKLKVIVRDATVASSNLSRGLMVRGGNHTSILVNTSNVLAIPSYELKNTVSQAQIGLQNTTEEVFIRYATPGGLYTPNPVAKFNKDGSVVLSTAGEFYVNSSGFLGINLSAAPTHPLDVRGTARIRTTAASAPMFFANGLTGLVGIATETPTQTLHVQGTFYASNEALFGNKVTVGATSHAGTTGASLTVFTSNAVADPPALAVRTISGNVGIGTATPLFKLDVRGDLNFNGNLYQNGAAYVSSQWTTSPLNATNIYYTAGNVGIGTTAPTERLHVTGNVFSTGSFMSTSDKTFKDALEPITDPLGRIAGLTGYTFVRRDPSPSLHPQPQPARETGLLAQDVAAVLPEAVTTAADGTLSLAYGNLAGLFVEAFKELQKEVATLRAELAELRAGAPSAPLVEQ